MTNKEFEEALQRLMNENSQHSNHLQCIQLELRNCPVTDGLSDLQAIKTLINQYYKLQEQIQALNNEIVLLKSKLAKNQHDWLKELIEK
jgi:hypothetical protein